MARLDDLLRTSAFQVLFDDQEVGVAWVGPLTSASDLESPPGRRSNRYATVVLRRALSTSTELFDGRRRVAGGQDDTRTVTIRQLSAPGGRVVNAWRLVGAWPVRWSGPAFDALSSEVAVEELELQFDDLVWQGSARPSR